MKTQSARERRALVKQVQARSRQGTLRCAVCARSFKDFDDPELTLDHIVPRSKGGKSHAKNLRISCRRCNHLRADGSPKALLKLEQQLPLRLRDGFIRSETRIAARSR